MTGVLTTERLFSIRVTPVAAPGGSEGVRMKREKLGKRLRRVRLERKLGLREAAAKVGLSAAYLSRIESCQDPRPPTERVIAALAELLRDDFDELMELAGRVPEDLEGILKADAGMWTLLRTAREHNISGGELLAMLEERKGLS